MLVLLGSMGAAILLQFLSTTEWLPEVLGRAAAMLTVCPHRLITGNECPLCGVTRAALLLMTGNPINSLRVHPLPVVLFPLFFAQIAWRAYLILRPGFHPRMELALLLLPLGTGAALAGTITS